MRASLDDVRWHRHRSARKLVPERGATSPAHPASHPMRIDRDPLRLLPHAEFSEICHDMIFMAGGPLAPSLVRTPPLGTAPCSRSGVGPLTRYPIPASRSP